MYFGSEKRVRTKPKDVVSRVRTNRVLLYIQARFACLRSAASGHFVSAGGALWAPGVTLINYKGDNISKYVCLTVIIDINF